MNKNENLLWSGTPSQWYGAPLFIICGLFSLALPLIPFTLLIVAWKLISIHKTKINITNQRITVEKGILSTTIDELELFRVKDIKLKQSLLYKFGNVSDLIITTSDRSNPTLIIPAIKNAKQLREELRNAVDTRRTEKGVREVDI